MSHYNSRICNILVLVNPRTSSLKWRWQQFGGNSDRKWKWRIDLALLRPTTFSRQSEQTSFRCSWKCNNTTSFGDNLIPRKILISTMSNIYQIFIHDSTYICILLYLCLFQRKTYTVNSVFWSLKNVVWGFVYIFSRNPEAIDFADGSTTKKSHC